MGKLSTPVPPEILKPRRGLADTAPYECSCGPSVATSMPEPHMRFEREAPSVFLRGSGEFNKPLGGLVEPSVCTLIVYSQQGLTTGLELTIAVMATDYEHRARELAGQLPRKDRDWDGKRTRS
jgi:hypothetical protein